MSIITLEQFMPRATTVGKGEFDGMVYCPQRLSSIAVLRCAEYQRERGCGIGCSHAATREMIGLVECDSKVDVDAAPDKSVCPRCGRPKSRQAKHCHSCAGVLSRRWSSRNRR